MISLDKKLKSVLFNLEKLSSSDTIDADISKYFLELINNHKKVPESKVIAKSLYVSQATLSRYIKKVGLNNLKELAFVIDNIGFDNQQTSKNVIENPVMKAANAIKNASKVFFWGISDCFFLLEDFNLKLQRLGINTVLNNYVKNQVSLSSLATKDDVVFIISFSGKHKEYQKAIKSIEAKKILITQSSKTTLFSNADIILPINKTNKSVDLRFITKKERIEALNYIDMIIMQLLSDPKLKKNNLKCIN